MMPADLNWRRYTVTEYAIPTSEDRTPLAELLEVTALVTKFCDDNDLSLDLIEDAHWRLQEWPEPGSPEHLVIRIRSDADLSYGG